ncbi:TetR/AcrR family transcriptional regulator [Eubacterium aggregans]|uniref:TetR/AcrR family transcriptional regulator n=1 Tax=Eubacterium aggregans TaxID=81409 RepID=UPI003F3E5892
MRSRKSTEVRKEEIVRAALFLVEQNGLDKLNIIDIAVEVKLVPAAIYRHFKGKEDIVAALIEFADKCLQCNLSQAMDYDGTAIVKLKLLFELHVKLLKEEAAIPRILYFLLSSERNPELKVGMLSAVGSYVQQVKKMILQGQKKGEINADVDVTAAAMLFLGMIQPLAILGQVDPNVLDECPTKLWQCYQRSIDL